MYRIIVTQNGVVKKTIYKSKDIEKSFIRFREIKKEIKSVLFPKEHINTNAIIPVKFKMHIVKDTEEGDKFRVIRDEYGKTKIEEPILGKWTVLDDHPYRVEEKFWMYGRDSKKNRITIHEIVKPLMLHAYKKTMVKQVIIVHNKLIFYNEDEFGMVLCKCKKDAQRLHHALAKACKKNKIHSIMFMGTACEVVISRMYDLIKEKTGWPMSKIYRRTTRP